MFSTLCGDGNLDVGEQCDDGNAIDGDGCSAGCRLPCVTPADCSDDDPCTEGRCRMGECARPRCGLSGGICALTDTMPAVHDSAACRPNAAGLSRMVRLGLIAARSELRAAKTQGVCAKKGHKGNPCVRTKHPSPKQLKKLLSDVTKKTRSVETHAARMEKRRKISPECRATVEQTLNGLTDEVHDMVLQKGVCAP